MEKQEFASKFAQNDTVILVGTGEAEFQTHECSDRRAKYHGYSEF